MIISTEISEDGEVIRLLFNDGDDSFHVDLDKDQCREIIQMLSASIMQAVSFDDFSKAKAREFI